MRYVNNNGEFYNGISVVIGDIKYISPNEEILAQAGYYPYVPPEPSDESKFELAKADKMADIDAYDSSTEVNVFYLNGNPLWLDAQTRQQLRTSIDAYQSSGVDVVTKWFNGQQFTFPTNVWLQMLNALEIYAAEALNVTELHRSEVSKIDNLDDLNAYDITLGYPEKLSL